MVDKTSIPPNVKSIMDTLTRKGFEAYIIGGGVRDTLLGLEPKDYDVFTNANGNTLLELFPKGIVVGGEERQSKILTVVVDGIEVSQYRKDGARTKTGTLLVNHVSTCDFTINAIAMDSTGKVLDLVNGQQDLANAEFGYIGEPKDRIHEDPLRILRAIRFMVKLGLSFRHMGTFKEYGYLIGNLPKERIRDEFLKIIQYDGGLERLISTGLIKYILPKFLENVGVSGGQHHNESVDAHLLYTFNHARSITDDRRLWLAGLLHDICKAETAVTEDSSVSFHMHEDKGARYAEQWMTELKFPKCDITFVTCLIKHHMWQFSKTLNKRSFVQHFRAFEDAGVSVYDFVALKYCDHRANQANERIKPGDFFAASPLIKKYFELKYTKEPFRVKDLVVKGQDLIDLGVKPGQVMGEMLEKLHSLVLDGDLPNERAALLHYTKTELL
jgi:tRNA nucleotidyltransferase (CCA-adding enzyme)